MSSVLLNSKGSVELLDAGTIEAVFSAQPSYFHSSSRSHFTAENSCLAAWMLVP